MTRPRLDPEDRTALLQAVSYAVVGLILLLGVVVAAGVLGLAIGLAVKLFLWAR